MSYLLRILLPDRPGSLGAVATAWGRVGGDIVGLDVVSRGEGHAVDDVLIELPPGTLADALVTAAESVPGVVVESVRRYVGAGELHHDLALVESLAAHPDSELKLLAEGLPGVFRASWAMVLEHRPPAVAPRAASVAAPRAPAGGLPWLPLAAATRLDSSATWVPDIWRQLDTELVAAPVGRPNLVVLVGRQGGPTFLPAEVARLAHLTGIAATVGRVELSRMG